MIPFAWAVCHSGSPSRGRDSAGAARPPRRPSAASPAPLFSSVRRFSIRSSLTLLSLPPIVANRRRKRLRDQTTRAYPVARARVKNCGGGPWPARSSAAAAAGLTRRQQLHLLEGDPGAARHGRQRLVRD